MAKPKCPVCKTIQPPVEGRRKYRCPKCKSWFEVGRDGPASNDPIRNFEMTTERKSL